MPLACSRRLHIGDSYTGRASTRRTHAGGATWGLAEPGGGGARRLVEPVKVRAHPGGATPLGEV